MNLLWRGGRRSCLPFSVMSLALSLYLSLVSLLLFAIVTACLVSLAIAPILVAWMLLLVLASCSWSHQVEFSHSFERSQNIN